MEAHLTILGTGSALPTFQNSPSGQILELCDKSFLIDCGEGIQLTMRQMNLKTSRLYSVFISHLHGDHCFGLLGLLTTFDMMGRIIPNLKDFIWLSPFSYANAADMLSGEKIYAPALCFGILITIGSIIFSFQHYTKKDLLS